MLPRCDGGREVGVVDRVVVAFHLGPRLAIGHNRARDRKSTRSLGHWASVSMRECNNAARSNRPSHALHFRITLLSTTHSNHSIPLSSSLPAPTPTRSSSSFSPTTLQQLPRGSFQNGQQTFPHPSSSTPSWSSSMMFASCVSDHRRTRVQTDPCFSRGKESDQSKRCSKRK